MPPALRDPATGLDCSETPFRPPKTLVRTDLAICNSCSIIFNGANAGPKTLAPLEKGGFLVDESPLIQVQYNDRTYGLSKTFLWKNGLHRDFKVDTNYDLELNLYFRDIFFPDKLLGVVIPITIDDTKAKPYFTEFSSSARTIPMNTLIGEGQVLVYKGIDIQNRNGNKEQTAEQCSSLTSSLNWLIFPTTYISSRDANHIRSIPLPVTNTPPAPEKEITLERARKMCMFIPKVELKSSVDALLAQKDKKKDIYLTRALQCQRIDPSKDVRGDAVYLSDKTGTTTLNKELDDAANLNSSLDDKTGGVRAKKIEDIIAYVVGTILGFILLALLAYFIYTQLFKGYTGVIEKAEILIAKADPCKPPLLI
jgi:hypothetical protein